MIYVIQWFSPPKYTMFLSLSHMMLSRLHRGFSEKKLCNGEQRRWWGGYIKLFHLYFQRLKKFLVVHGLCQKEVSTMSESEVTRLRRQIELELVAMQRGMNGFALGTTRHRFIRTRMDRVGVCQDQLAVEVG